MLMAARCSLDNSTSRHGNDALPAVARQQREKAGEMTAKLLISGIPAWSPSEVRRAVQHACGHPRLRVQVHSSGQAGVCLGTATVEAVSERLQADGRLLLHRNSAALAGGTECECAQVVVTHASGQPAADAAFPCAPLNVREALQLPQGPHPPPSAWALAAALVALASTTSAPDAASSWTWAEWDAWADISRHNCTLALVDPGFLGLQIIYKGLPFEVRRADEEWRLCSETLLSWADRRPAATAARTIVGDVSAAAAVGSETGVLWSSSWPWPSADVELPCPDGALLIHTGSCGQLGEALAHAWHSAQPWCGSRSAKKLWRGGVMGESSKARSQKTANRPRHQDGLDNCG